MTTPIDFEKLHETGLYIPADSVLSSSQHETIVAVAEHVHALEPNNDEIEHGIRFAYAVASDIYCPSDKIPDGYSDELIETIKCIESIVNVTDSDKVAPLELGHWSINMLSCNLTPVGKAFKGHQDRHVNLGVQPIHNAVGFGRLIAKRMDKDGGFEETIADTILEPGQTYYILGSPMTNEHIDFYGNNRIWHTVINTGDVDRFSVRMGMQEFDEFDDIDGPFETMPAASRSLAELTERLPG